MAAGSLKGIMKPLEGVKESKSIAQKKPAATLAAIKPPSMEGFKPLITKARIQGKKAGLKQSDITAAIAKARSRR
jgi:hypothetical protein